MDVIDLIAIKQAYEDGSQIEYRHKVYDHDWVTAKAEPVWNLDEYEFRIKDDSNVCVPYRNGNEFVAARQEHGPKIVTKDKSGKEIILEPWTVRDTSVCICLGNKYTYTKYSCLADNEMFRWEDGTPCGKTANA